MIGKVHLLRSKCPNGHDLAFVLYMPEFTAYEQALAFLESLLAGRPVQHCTRCNSTAHVYEVVPTRFDTLAEADEDFQDQLKRRWKMELTTQDALTPIGARDARHLN